MGGIVPHENGKITHHDVWEIWFNEEGGLENWCCDYVAVKEYKDPDIRLKRWVREPMLISELRERHKKFTLLDTKEFGYYYETP